MRAILSVRPKCSHRCVSLKETPLKPVQILKHTSRVFRLSRPYAGYVGAILSRAPKRPFLRLSWIRSLLQMAAWVVICDGFGLGSSRLSCLTELNETTTISPQQGLLRQLFSHQKHCLETLKDYPRSPQNQITMSALVGVLLATQKHRKNESNQKWLKSDCRGLTPESPQVTQE